MVAIGSKRFDPAEHLTKQGWKGKGTALKSGHLTRPLAVIQKKTLSGVGKDRDEAVPFWDQIFAATAASLSLPSTPLSLSPSSTPVPQSGPTPKLADPRGNKSGSWQTSGSSGSANQQPLGQAGLSVGVRIARDVARRGLYSRFLRGEVVVEPELEESGAEVKVDRGVGPEAEAGPSRLGGCSTPASAVDGDEAAKVKETKEEKKARRAARAVRKAERADAKASRAGEAVQVEEAGEQSATAAAAAVDLTPEEDTKEARKRKRRADKVERAALGVGADQGGGRSGRVEVDEGRRKKKLRDND